MDRMTVCETVDPSSILGRRTFIGGLAEWFMAHASKACGRKSAEVQILYPPQLNLLNLMKEQTNNYPEAKFYKDHIAKEQEKIKDFLIDYLPANFKPDNIMDFCCGAANEEPVLYELYGKDISMTSFDNSEHMLQRIKDLGVERKSIIRLDIDEIDDYFQNKKFDLLIGRNIPINPNSRSFSNEKYPDNWPKRLENLKKHLGDNGYLLMTFARKDEFYRAQELLNDLSYNIVSQEKNRIIIPSDYIGIAGADVKDNYVVLAMK